MPGSQLPEGSPAPPSTYSVLLALYEAPSAPPRLVKLEDSDFRSLVRRVSDAVFQAVTERGAALPPAAIREVVENLLHASFRDALVSVSADGRLVTVSDHGPGIPDPERALRPGFSSATAALRSLIRGVGSGLPLAQELLRAVGGDLRIDENLGGGAVVTLTLPPATDPAGSRPPAKSTPPAGTLSRGAEYPSRQPADDGPLGLLGEQARAVLRFLARHGEAGPSQCARSLGVSVSSAYRSLVSLQEAGLVEGVAGGRRRLTQRARELLERTTGE